MQVQRRLEQTTPRGKGDDPRGHGFHTSELYTVTPIERRGSIATITVANAKRVKSKEGQSWWLIALLEGGTMPHNIPHAFGRGRVRDPLTPPGPNARFVPFGSFGRFEGMFHPGTEPNTFAQKAVAEVRARSNLHRVVSQLRAGVLSGEAAIPSSGGANG
jgi:hypothetical protein